MSDAAVVAYVGLGSNLDQPERQVRLALSELDQLPQTRLRRRSSLYRSPPLGPPGQANYVNAVAMLDTALEPLPLLDQLQSIERRHARVRGVRWGPRTLDLDLLLYGEREISSPRLSVPHPQMHQRAFVLVPLNEVTPDLQLPGLGPLSDRLRALDVSGLHRIAVSNGE